LVTFGFGLWEMLIFSVVENSNKFQNTKLWKEKSVEDMVTLGPMAHATLVVMDCYMPMEEMMSY
jgi:hypothetical protein